MDAKQLLESLHAPELPLHVDKYGAIRVGGTRVTLDTVLINFQLGSSPECIVQNFPVLKLEDVYTLIAYYLRNRAAFDAYLEELERIAQENRKKWEALYPNENLRERLLKRYQEMHQAPPLSDRQWLLFLTLLPDVGRKTLRHVLERQQVRRETPEEVISLPAETLRAEYQLPPRAVQAIREGLAQRLEETQRLEAHLTRCGVRWLSFQDAAYPHALEDMPEPPAVLFAYGDYALLSEPCFALLASHTVSAQGLSALEQVAESLMAQGFTPIVSATQPAYQRALLCAVRRGAPYVLTLDRGLLSAFGEDLRKEPLKQARIWQAEFDPHNTLALSPFRPRDGWVAANGKYRDALIGYLASAVIVIEARPDGYIVQLCQQLLQHGRKVYALTPRAGEHTGNQQLLSVGATPFAPQGTI